MNVHLPELASQCSQPGADLLLRFSRIDQQLEFAPSPTTFLQKVGNWVLYNNNQIVNITSLLHQLRKADLHTSQDQQQLLHAVKVIETALNIIHREKKSSPSIRPEECMKGMGTLLFFDGSKASKELWSLRRYDMSELLWKAAERLTTLQASSRSPMEFLLARGKAAQWAAFQHCENRQTIPEGLSTASRHALLNVVAKKALAFRHKVLMSMRPHPLVPERFITPSMDELSLHTGALELFHAFDTKGNDVSCVAEEKRKSLQSLYSYVGKMIHLPLSVTVS